jgi:hypothetical protein
MERLPQHLGPNAREQREDQPVVPSFDGSADAAAQKPAKKRH